MRQLWLLLLLTLASVLPAWCQSGTTLVTAKVVDTGGSIYVNCSWSVVFVGENTTPGAGPYAPAPLLNGQQGACDSQGNLSVNLADNILTVFPQPSQWSFSICSAGGYLGGPFCKVNIPITITGATQNISSILTPLMPLLPTGGGAGGGPTLFPSTPTGICTPSQTGVNTSTGEYYSCAGGSWLKVGPISSAGNPGGSAFQVQTNTSGLAFGGITNTTAGSVLASQGTGAFPAFQLKPVIDARDYGVTGNGTTDDTTAMQAAVTAACPSGGKGSALILPNSFQVKLTSTLIAAKCSGWSFGTSSPQGQATIPSGNAALLWYGAAGGTVLELNQVRDSDVHNITIDTEASNHSAVGANTAILIDEIGTVTNIVTNNHFDNIGIYNATANANFIGVNICPTAPGNCEAQNFDRLILSCRGDFVTPTATDSGTGIIWEGGQPNYSYIHWIYGSGCSTAISGGSQVVDIDGGLMNSNYTDLAIRGGIAVSYKNIESQLSIAQITISGSPFDIRIEDDVFSGLTNNTTTIGYSGTSGVKYTLRHNAWDLNNTVTPIGPISSGVLNGDLVSENNRYPGSICPNTSTLGTWSSIGDSCTVPPFNNTLTLGGPVISLLTPFSHTYSYVPITAVGATFSTRLGTTGYVQNSDLLVNATYTGSYNLDDVSKHGWDVNFFVGATPAINFYHFSPMANPNTSLTTPFSILATGITATSIIDSGISASTSPICPNGTGGAFTTSGCSGGGSTAFSGLTGGTNTTAAMVLGSGASLTFSGSGTNNASTLLSGTWGAPAAAIGNVTPVPGASGFTSLTATGTVDFTGTSIAKLRVAAGLTTSVNGDIGYDSTNTNWHAWNGADLIMVPMAAGFVSGDCPQPTLVSGKWTLQDTGGTCSTGGSSGLSGMTATQVPIAATSTTITSSEALAGSGAGITTGPVSGVTTLTVTEFTGTGGQIASSGILAANLTTAASNYTSGDLIQAAGANKTTSDSAIATANVVTATSNFTSGHIPKAAGSNKTLADGYPVAGTDTNLLSSGTISGTAVLLCTDANGGATTSGCPSTGGNVSTSGTITSGQIAIWASTTTIKSAAMSGDGTLSSAGVLTNIGLNGTLLSGLATGILKNTTSTGVPSIAISSDVISIFTGCSASPTTTYLRADGSCQAPPGSGTINPSLQFSMPYYSAAGSSTTISGSPAPTGPNGIAQTFCTTPSGSAATLGVWCIPGVPIDAQTGTSYTIPITDDVTFLTGNNASATAWTGFALANNYAFSFANLGAGLITYTPASGTVNGNATQIIPKNYFGFHYTDNTNTFMPVMPTIAAFTDCHGATNAVIFTSATGAFGCNTISGGSSGLSGMTAGQVPIAATASTVTSSEALAGGGAGITTGPVSGVTTLDLTEFTGTGGQIADSGILAANVVTQTSNAVSGQVCTYTGTNKVCVPATALPNGITATTQTAGDSSTDVATDAFVATGITNAIAAVNPATAVLAASTANLTGTYAQVGGGVGDTFTVTATGAFSLDGIAINTIGQRVLLKNQTTASQNGIYTATVVGTTGVSPIFTRALDYDMPSDVNNTGSIPVQSGTVNTTTSWLLTSQVTSIGSSGSSLTYAQFSLNPAVAVTSVANSDSTLTITPTTGAVVGSLNLAHANTWSALQTFGTSISIGGVTAAGATGTSNVVFSNTPTLVTPVLGAATATSLLASGIVDGKAPITITTGTTATLGAATYQSGYTFNQEATAGTGVTYTLPATAVGLQYCVRNSIVSGTGAADTGVLTVYPPSSSYVILNGVRNTIGGGGTHGVASGGAAGDSACFVAIDATDWEVYVQRGTWTAN